MAEGGLVAGLDLGTSVVSCVAAEVMEDGRPRIVGAGQAPVSGSVREGVLLDVESCATAAARAVEQAEMLCTEQIERVFISVSGAHVRGFEGVGTVCIEKSEGSIPREITAEDVARAEETARLVKLPPGCRLLDVVRRDYCVDGFDRLRRPPLGLVAEQISARVYTIIADRIAVSNLESAVSAAGLEVEGVVPAALAAGMSSLSEDEREMGVAVADIGAGTTDVAVFSSGSIAHLGVVPLGGNAITSDLQALRIPWAQAEKLKTEWAVSTSTMVDPNQTLKVLRLGGRGTFNVSHPVVSQVVGQRAEEIFEGVSAEIARSGLSPAEMPGGLVLTGGSSRLRGLAEVASRVTGMPVEQGAPMGVETSTDLVLSPEFSTAVGLVLMGAARRAERPERPEVLGGLIRWISSKMGRIR